MDASDLTRRQRALLAVVRWIEPESNPGVFAYGVLAVGSVLAVEDAPQVSYQRLAEAAVTAVLLYWLAHAYAVFLGHRLDRQPRVSLGLIWSALRKEWALVRGAAAPCLVLLGSWLAGWSPGAGVTAVLWTCAVMLVALNVVPGVRAGHRLGALLLDAGVGIALGLALPLLRVLLH